MNAIIEAVGWTLLHFLWQGALIAALFGLFIVFVGRRAQVRYLAGCLALLGMVGAVAATFASHYHPPAVATDVTEAKVVDAKTEVGTWTHYTHLSFEKCRAAHEIVPIGESGAKADQSCKPIFLTKSVPPAGVVRQDKPPPEAKAAETAAEEETASAWPSWLVGLWVTGVLLLSLRLAFAWFLAERLKVRAVEEISSLSESLRRVAGVVGVSRPVRILQSAAVTVPTVVGWLRPVILLPAASIIGLSRGQLEAVLAHELAHIRRHDYLVNLLQHAVEILLFFHPAVWWVSRKIREEREHCCDDIAVAISGGALLYVQVLATLEELRSNQPDLVMAANGGSLLSRIRRLTGAHKSRRFPLVAIPLLLLGAAIAFPIELLRSEKEPARERPGPEAQPAKSTRVHPLPSDEAARGLRHLLAKDPESGLLYDDFERLARVLNQEDLVALLDEIGRKDKEGYRRWTRCALFAEWARRDHDAALEYFKAQQEGHFSSGHASLYAIFRASRPEDPEEALRYLRSLADDPRYKRNNAGRYPLAHSGADWIKHANKRIFAEFAAADAERAWTYLPGREPDRKEDAPLNHNRMASSNYSYVSMVEGFFSGLPDAATIEKYVKRFGPVGEPGTEHVAIVIAKEWMRHDIAAAQAWAPPERHDPLVANLIYGVEGNAAGSWAKENPEMAIQALRDNALPRWSYHMARSLLEGNPELAVELVGISEAIVRPPPQKIAVTITDQNGEPRHITTSTSTVPDKDAPSLVWSALRHSMRAKGSMEEFPEPGRGIRSPDREARYESYRAAIASDVFSEEERTKLQAHLDSLFKDHLKPSDEPSAKPKS